MRILQATPTHQIITPAALVEALERWLVRYIEDEDLHPGRFCELREWHIEGLNILLYFGDDGRLVVYDCSEDGAKSIELAMSLDGLACFLAIGQARILDSIGQS